MATITDIKSRILQLAPAPFQEFCDTLIYKNGYGVISGYGMQAGTGKTTKGNPDTYFESNGKYVLVAYTTQQSDIYNKLKEDIEKCLDSNKTKLETSAVDLIICCHTSSNLNAGEDKKLHEICNKKGISLIIWGIDEIANQILNKYRSMAKDFLNLTIDTNQILSYEDFIVLNDSNEMLTPLKTTFQYRENDKKEIKEALDKHKGLIITGSPGVGKTRLTLESSYEYAKENNYKLLCVKNNNLELFNDLISYMEEPGKYLFFVDDANELMGLNHIIQFVTQKDKYEVKVITTVRDYVKKNVIMTMQKYTTPFIKEVQPLINEEIRGILNVNLGIRNEEYVNQIIQIAMGNPRIAYMAGKLALNKQNLDAITDVSELYETYYSEYKHSIFQEDEHLYFTIGVLSIVNAVLLDDLTHLQNLLNSYGISENEFKSKINTLSKLEVVEIHLDKVAKLSDQCLANFMLYYVFCDKKIFPLSKVLEIGYKYFYDKTITAVETIFSLFSSEKTKEYCQEEILSVWDKLKKEKHPQFENFVRDFHTLRPEESFEIAKQKIDNIKKQEFEANKVVFSNRKYNLDELCLELLSGYKYSCELDYVLELLLYYASKSEQNIISGFNWLKNNYGISISDHRYKYYTQQEISRYLLKAISENNNIAKAIGIQWVTYSLKFDFNSTEILLGESNMFYYWNLKDSEGIHEYRQTCWKILELLSKENEWTEAVLIFFENYCSNLNSDYNKTIFENDIKNMRKVLERIRNKNLRYLRVINNLMNSSKSMNISYSEEWQSLLVGGEWEIYKLLEFDYSSLELSIEDYESERSAKLVNYGKTVQINNIVSLVKELNNIWGELGQDYYFNQGLEIMISQFDDRKLSEFLTAFIQFGKNIDIAPHLVLEPLLAEKDSNDLYVYLINSNFPQKNKWIFTFFETLPKSKVNITELRHFLEFLKDDSDKDDCFGYRNIKVLEKFIDIEPKIYPIASDIIFEKRHYSSDIVNKYFYLLFKTGEYSPKRILNLYQNEVSLIQDIYFYMLNKSNYVDSDGVFLSYFLSLKGRWIEKYVELIINDSFGIFISNSRRNRELWRLKQFVSLFDYMFDSLKKEKNKLISYFKTLLINGQNDDFIGSRQLEWIKHIIEKNASNDVINVIFKFINELDNNIRIKSFQIFLENNQDFEMFNKLPLNHSSSFTDIVGFIQEEIDFLESLYPLVSEFRFIKHKKKLRELVENYRKYKRDEEAREIWENARR